MEALGKEILISSDCPPPPKKKYHPEFSPSITFEIVNWSEYALWLQNYN